MKCTVHPRFSQIGGVLIKEIGLSYCLLSVSSVQQHMEFSTVDSSGVHNYYWQSNDLGLRKECKNLQKENVKYADKTLVLSHTITGNNSSFQGD